MISGLRQTHSAQVERQIQFGEPTTQEFDFHSTSVYAYSYWKPVDFVTLIAGASADFLEGRSVDQDEVSPKFGLAWSLSSRSMLRLAAMHAPQPDAFSQQDIPPRLEPTQVAGFNQVYSGQVESAWVYAVGFNHEFTGDMTFDAEVVHRDLSIPFLNRGPPDVVVATAATEWWAQAGFFWTPLPAIAASAGYRYERRENEGVAVFTGGIDTLETHRVSLGLSFFHSTGISAEATVTYVDQRGNFLTFLPVPPFIDFATAGDQFVVADAALRYRLPRRRGIVVLSVGNLTDEDFRFQDVDPQNPDITPERLVTLKFTMAF